MYTHIKEVVVLVYQPYGFLLFTVVVYLFQAVEASHAMIDVRNIIALFQVMQFLQRKSFLFAETFPQAKLMITLKYLVIRFTLPAQYTA